MNKYKVIITVAMLSLLSGLTIPLAAQEVQLCPICEQYMFISHCEPVLVHDTIYISNMNDITHEFGMTFDDFVRTFLKVAGQKDTTGAVSVEKIYHNYLLPLLNPGYGYRLVSRQFIINPADSVVNLQPVMHPLVDSLENANMRTDILLTIYGIDNTNAFLKSPTLIKSCLGQLFEAVYQLQGKIDGVNFYFPDYTFKEKRAMAQFIKSVSLVIDSCGIQSLRDLNFYASFREDLATGNEQFLNGMANMADSIFIFHYATAANSLPEITVIDRTKASKMSILPKLKNQFYLARYFVKPFPETNDKEFKIQDIYNLIEADYDDNHWEEHLFIIIAIITLILVSFVCFLTIPAVSYYVNKNIDYVYSILVLLFLELLIMTAYMFEDMSRENVFSLNNDSRHIILLLPLLFIFIIPMMKTLGRKRNLP